MNVYTGGTFDLLHPGHIELLRASRGIAEAARGFVLVGLNSDEFVERYKGRPVQSYAERKRMLEACKYVDFVIPNSGDEDSKPALEQALIQRTVQSYPQFQTEAFYQVGTRLIITVGSDWADQEAGEWNRYYRQIGVTAEWLDEKGIQVLFVPRTTRFSTTMLRRQPHLCTLHGPAECRCSNPNCPEK